MISLLNHLDAQVELTPLEVNPQRYGNKAFQKYYSWLCGNGSQICSEKLEIEPSTGAYAFIHKHCNLKKTLMRLPHILRNRSAIPFALTTAPDMNFHS